MAEKQPPFHSGESSDPSPPRVPRRVSGAHVDVRDTVAELAERAQSISQEAGTKVTAAMKDVIGAAAGIAGFAIESVRDLVQYMVRRGQMTPDEGERLIREAEAAHEKRHPGERGRAAAKLTAAKTEVGTRAAPYARPVSRTPVAPPAVVPSAHPPKAPQPVVKSDASKPSAAAKGRVSKPVKADKAKTVKPPKKRK